MRFVYILKEWANSFPYDFRELPMVECVEFVQKKCLMLDESIRDQFNSVFAFLAKEVTVLTRFGRIHIVEINKKKSVFKLTRSRI